MKRNIPLWGFLLGALTPLLGFLVVFLILGKGQSLGAFSASLVHNHQNFAKVLSLSILANVIPFIIYTNKRLDLTARGIFIATMLYVVVYLLMKFAW